MKVTLVIDDRLHHRLREEAARRRTSISRVVEDALIGMLDAAQASTSKPSDLPAADLGASRVDVSDRDALERAMTSSDER
jgi:hypothetical protein